MVNIKNNDNKSNFDDFKSSGQSPWGSSPGGNGSGRGPTPPNIDDIIRKIQEFINKYLPGSKSSGTPIIIGIVTVSYTHLTLPTKA